MQPPLLPLESLIRVLRLARTDGLWALMVATFFALTSAAVGDLTGAAAWLLVAGAGAIELHGATLLREAELRGMNWLLASQFLLLFVVLAYCALRLAHYDPTAMRAAMTAETKASLVQAGYEPEEFLRTVYISTYSVMAGVAFIYKGCLARYFLRRREAVAAALETAD